MPEKLRQVSLARFGLSVPEEPRAMTMALLSKARAKSAEHSLAITRNYRLLIPEAIPGTHITGRGKTFDVFHLHSKKYPELASVVTKTRVMPPEVVDNPTYERARSLAKNQARAHYRHERALMFPSFSYLAHRVVRAAQKHGLAAAGLEQARDDIVRHEARTKQLSKWLGNKELSASAREDAVKNYGSAAAGLIASLVRFDREKESLARESPATARAIHNAATISLAPNVPRHYGVQMTFHGPVQVFEKIPYRVLNPSFRLEAKRRGKTVWKEIGKKIKTIPLSELSSVLPQVVKMFIIADENDLNLDAHLGNFAFTRRGRQRNLYYIDTSELVKTGPPAALLAEPRRRLPREKLLEEMTQQFYASVLENYAGMFKRRPAQMERFKARILRLLAVHHYDQDRLRDFPALLTKAENVMFKGRVPGRNT
jgi:hypothetical protein